MKPTVNGRGLLGSAVILLFSFLNVLAGQEAPAAGQRIPAISGVVVDAVTGKPLAGVDVILRAQKDSPHKQLRYETYSSTADGRFHFPESVDSDAVGLFSPMFEISLSINKVFVSVDRLRAATHEEWQESDGLSDVSWFAMSATLPEDEPTPRRNVGRPASSLNNQAYFPMSAQFLKDCDTHWNVTCVVPDSFTDVRISLIPVLSDPSECKKIADADFSDRCRQLNAYHAAFVHLDSFAQVRAAKESCRSVDHGHMSEECLTNLRAYLWRNEGKRLSPSLLREYEPKEKILILEPVAGFLPQDPGFRASDPFNEEGSYYVQYRPDRGTVPLSSEAHVLVFVGGTAESRKQALGRELSVGKEDSDVVRQERVFLGNAIATLEFARSVSTKEVSRQYVTAWTSGAKVIAISLTYPSARDVAVAGGEENARNGTITPEMRRELIRAYLQKYPSSD
jgi:hypothetical protein